MAKFVINIPDSEVLNELREAAELFDGTLHPSLEGRKRLPKKLKEEIAADIQNYIRNQGEFFLDGVNNDLYQDWISYDDE